MNPCLTRTLSRIATVGALALMTTVASAQVTLYDSLGPLNEYTDGYDSTYWYNQFNYQDRAVQFTAGGSDLVPLLSVELPVALGFLDDIQFDTGFVMSLYTDAGGSLGSLVETLTHGPIVNGEPEIRTLLSSTNPLIQGGASYWLTFETPHTQGSAYDWLWANAISVTGVGERGEHTDGEWFTSGTQGLDGVGAFRVLGQQGNQAVPEPGTWALLAGTGALAGLAIRRRRAR
jgi:hypothetical protein